MLLFLVSALSASAQSDRNTHPDFNGTWKLNGFASKIPGLGVVTAKKDSLLEIAYADPMVKTTDKTKMGDKYVITAEKIFYTDGRGEVNDGESDGKHISVKSKTKWNGKNLIREFADKTKEEWSLSADGKTLTKKITISLKGDKTEVFFVYEKAALTQ